MNEIKDCVGILINTCEELESQFIEYIWKEIEKPIWAAGPLLPSSSFSDQSTTVTHDSAIRSKKSSIDEDQCLPSSSFSDQSTTVTHDSAIRSKKSSIDEDQCLERLNSKAPASVLFVSFCSEVEPSDEEIRELALGLEAAQKPFIWVLQNHYHDHPPPSLLKIIAQDYCHMFKQKYCCLTLQLHQSTHHYCILSGNLLINFMCFCNGSENGSSIPLNRFLVSS